MRMIHLALLEKWASMEACFHQKVLLREKIKVLNIVLMLVFYAN